MASRLIREANIGEASRREAAIASGERVLKSYHEAAQSLEVPLVEQMRQIHDNAAAAARQVSALDTQVTEAHKLYKTGVQALGNIGSSEVQTAAEEIDRTVRILENVVRQLNDR